MAVSLRFHWGFIVIGLVAVGLIVLLMQPAKTTVKAKTTVTPVTVAQVNEQDTPVTLTELGAAQAWQGVVIRTQVNGKLTAVLVNEGSYVRKGQVVAQIDEAPYRAALMQVQGALARDRALLKQARTNLARYQTLARENSIARQQVEDQAALVAQDEGLVKLDEGAVAAAQVNVNYCKIRSPLAGRAGVRLVDPGNIVSTTDANGIITVNQVSPIAVTFSLPEGEFQRVAALSAGFTRSLTVEALSQETGASLGDGEIRIADNHVDPATGTIQLKARFANDQSKLWPGQFVNVRLRLKVLEHAVTIPAAAVNQGPNGAFAYVVGPDQKVSARPLTVETTQGDVAVIRSGLKAGETVVVDGQMILKPGAKVQVHTAPAAKKSAP